MNLGKNHTVQGLQDEYDRNFNILPLGKLTVRHLFFFLIALWEKSTGKKRLGISFL